MVGVTTCITVSCALAHKAQMGEGGIENENEAEDWGFRTVSCSGVALLPMWQHVQH